MLDEELEKMGYIVDSVTGFLQKNLQKTENVGSVHIFNPREKTAFLKALKTHGNQSKAANDLGYRYSEVQWHLRHDVGFREAFEETLLEMKHELEGKLYKSGLMGRSKEAKIWLDAHFPAEYKASGKPAPKKDKKDALIDDLYNKSL